MKKRRDFADWTCELFDALGIKQAFVGNSYGGFLAVNQASLAPERVKQLVMINPRGTFVSFLPHLLNMLWFQLLEAVHLKPKRSEPDIAKLFGRDVHLRPDEAEWAAMLLMGDNELLYDPHATLRLAKQRILRCRLIWSLALTTWRQWAKPQEVNARIVHFLQEPSQGLVIS